MPEVIAIIIFTVVAVFGLIILLQVFKNKRTPKLIVYSHGFIALVGLLVLWVEINNGNTDSLLVVSTILFSVAAFGGICLFLIDIFKKRIPKTLAVIHPLIAITALIILVVYVMY